MRDPLAKFRPFSEGVVDMVFVVIAGQIRIAANQFVIDKLLEVQV